MRILAANSLHVSNVILQNLQQREGDGGSLWGRAFDKVTQ